MYTDHIIKLQEHFNWLRLTIENNKNIVFIIFVNDKVSGLVSIDPIDLLNKKSKWGFYIDRNSRKGLGPSIEFALINYVFNDLKLEKLSCEVIDFNESVIKMHKKFCFDIEIFKDACIEKNGEYRGIYYLSLYSKKWRLNVNKIFEKYKKIFSKFNIKFEI